MSVSGLTYTTPEDEAVAENNEDLMSEFQEFLAAKEAKKQEEAATEDFDVEIWDKDGRGVRTKRSHAKPFLNTLGLDLDPEPEKTEDKDGDKGKKNPPAKSRTSTPSQSTVRKYFAPKASNK